MKDELEIETKHEHTRKIGNRNMSCKQESK